MVSTRHRLTIRTLDRDPRSVALSAAAHAVGIQAPGPIDVADIVFVNGELDATDLDRLHRVLVDRRTRVPRRYGSAAVADDQRSRERVLAYCPEHNPDCHVWDDEPGGPAGEP